MLHFFQGLSYRQIARQEGVFFTSVAESLEAAMGKLKKYFEKIVNIMHDTEEKEMLEM